LPIGCAAHGAAASIDRSRIRRPIAIIEIVSEATAWLF
jgi:hypothetical protein